MARASFGLYNTREEVDALVEGIQKVREGLTVTTTNFVTEPMPSAKAEPNK